MESLVEEEAQTERQQRRQALGKRLEQLLKDLDNDAQQLLSFYYCDGMTQKDMAQALNVKQHTISRKLSRIRQAMVKQLAAWSMEQMAMEQTATEQTASKNVDSSHTGPDLDLLSNVSNVLDEWLQQHFSASATKPSE